MRSLALLSVGFFLLATMGCAAPSSEDSASGASANLTTEDGSHYVHCEDQMTQLTFEQTATEHTLKVREDAYHGQTLGLILEETLAPAFSHTATGDYIELTLHLPVGATECTFSSARDTLFTCGGPYPRQPTTATVTDGVTTVALDDVQTAFSTEFRHVVSALSEEDEMALHLELFGPSHPYPTGYIREEAFAPELCTTTRP